MSAITRWTPRQRRLAVDLALVAVLGALTVMVGHRVLYSPDVSNPKAAFATPGAHRDAVWALVIAGVQLAALLCWRRFPVSVFAAATIGLVLHVEVLAAIQLAATHPFTGPPLLVSDLSVAVALYGVTLRHGLLRAGPALAGAVAASALAVGRALAPWSWTSFVMLALIGVACWIAAETTRSRRAYLSGVEQRAADQARRHAQEIELAAATERVRITRDIHDSVAHGLSIIVVQAQAASAALTNDPVSASESIRAIVTTGRDALTEMRRSLSVLTSADMEPLAQRLANLAGLARAAGMPVHLSIDGDLGDLPADVEQAAYRVVQESLTNARDHAGSGVSVDVEITRTADQIRIDVADDGRPIAAPVDGLGIDGMRQRVCAAGGNLDAGPHPSGGFVVTARMPLTDAGGPS